MCGVCSQQVIEEIERLENGLTKLRSTTEEVALLEERLKESKVVVEEKREQADALMSRVGAEKVPLRLIPSILHCWMEKGVSGGKRAREKGTRVLSRACNALHTKQRGCVAFCFCSPSGSSRGGGREGRH